MCTPDNLRENCKCPYVTRRLLRRVAGVVAVLAVVVGMWVLAAAGYAWTLGAVAWLAVLAVAGLLVRRLAEGWLLVHRYIPASTRAAAATRTGTPRSRSPGTGRTRPGTPAPDAAAVPAAVPAGVPVRAHVADGWLPARTGHPG